jgi:hypothetical protein
MGKIRIPNARGHYEMDGFDIDVDDRDIIIRTTGKTGKDTGKFHHVRDDDDDRREDRRKEPEQENMSILSSIGKISRSGIFDRKK